MSSGCVLDAMADCPMPANSPARTNAGAYMRARMAQIGRLRRTSVETSSQPDSSESHDTLQSLLFERLPGIAKELLQQLSATPDQPSSVYFFNEHYVVKPPASEVEFRWHRDDDEQLAMCVHRQQIRPYLSMWCALDDITTTNGALRFIPRSLSTSNGSNDDPQPTELTPSATLLTHATAPVLVQAGSVVCFLSDVWHCSAANESTSPRRAFYVQYSSMPITATSHAPAPLSFAIACGGDCTHGHGLASVDTRRCIKDSKAATQSTANHQYSAMLPLRLRNQTDHDDLTAQAQYSPFRLTAFDAREEGDEEATFRGPGSLCLDEWKSVALQARRRQFSLYRSERDVQPTTPATVQAIYNAQDAHDLAAQLPHRGNACTSLKSATPRFSDVSVTQGPGSYFPEKYHGAFPQLLEKVTPSAVQAHKAKQKIKFDTIFAIMPTSANAKQPHRPSAPASSPPHQSALLGRPSPRSTFARAFAMLQGEPHRMGEALPTLQSARLTAALSPKNAYSDKHNRAIVLANKH
ncbi:TPA: LOW QUALITY PROTEIN: hypothetical protein N0F65_008402 [Lagenidium giganteum]|uniref:Phytanoyl-CoA dioxygenase n=1 Tax=Lagenidium giganteum TaxID=4803 RepID=A0AAV2YVK5_9STRA|nr:TPA: LOW QUALITY PROTEIN: hypothetical protein N0F65_008402 [Lagenidium giganteum]